MYTQKDVFNTMKLMRYQKVFKMSIRSIEWDIYKRNIDGQFMYKDVSLILITFNSKSNFHRLQDRSQLHF